MERVRFTYQTEIDPTLDHQVVMSFVGVNVGISCNCLFVKRKQSHKVVGVSTCLEESRALYNNPANHAKPFTKEDEARW